MKLESDLVHLGEWFNNNRLSLNVTKTKSMLLCGNTSKLRHDSLNVTMNDVDIECVQDIKYIGVIIDRRLSFTNHVNKLCGKILSKTGILW